MPAREQQQPLEWDPTPEEIAIKELRIKIKDIIFDDSRFDDDLYLVQWLKAQKLNPGKAETMIRNSLAWRKNHNVNVRPDDEIQTEVGKAIGFRLGANDRNGAPVGCIHLGKSDLRKAIETYGREAVSSYFYLTFARLEASMIEHNKRNNVNSKRITSDSTTGITAILNIKDYSLRQAQSLESIRVYLDIARCGVSYFPAILSRLICVNVNTVFSMIFKLVKPLLTIPGLKQDIYGYDEKIWKKAMMERIDPSELSPDFGGSNMISYIQ